MVQSSPLHKCPRSWARVRPSGVWQGRRAVPKVGCMWEGSLPRKDRRMVETGGTALGELGGHRKVQGGKNCGYFCHVVTGWGLGLGVSPAHTGKFVRGPYKAFTVGSGALPPTPLTSHPSPPSHTLIPCAPSVCPGAQGVPVIQTPLSLTLTLNGP